MSTLSVCFRRSWQRLALNLDRAAVAAAGTLAVARYRRSAKQGERPLRLLSVEIGGLGDLTRITPFREALRAAYPDARLTVITHQRNSPFFQWAAPPEDVVLFKPEHRSWGGKFLFFLELQCRGPFDITVDFTGSYFSAWITRLSGARRCAGSPREGFGRFYSDPIHRRLDRPLAEHYAALLRAVGAGDTKGKSYKSARTRTGGNNAGDRPRIVVHPGSGWPGRRWPIGCWRELVRRLEVETGGRVTVTGGGGETELAGEVAAAGRRTDMLAGRLSFSQLAALLEQADCFISANVGPMHLARAVGCPTVTLYGPYSPVETGYPGDPDHRAVTRSLPCSPCGTYTHTPLCTHFACLRGITVDEVVTAVLPALNGRGSLSAEVSP